MIATSLKLESSIPSSKNAKQEPELKPYTMDEINQMIDDSLDDIKNGRVYTLEEFNKKMEEDIPWLK